MLAPKVGHGTGEVLTDPKTGDVPVQLFVKVAMSEQVEYLVRACKLEESECVLLMGFTQQCGLPSSRGHPELHTCQGGRSL